MNDRTQTTLFISRVEKNGVRVREYLETRRFV